MKAHLFLFLIFLMLTIYSCSNKTKNNSIDTTSHNDTLSSIDRDSNQINENQVDKYNLDKDCDCAGGQQYMNVCYANAGKKLYTIMENKYKCLIEYFENEKTKHSKSAKDNDILEDIIKEEKALISSQKAWEELSDRNSEYWGIGGGTITPMYVAQSWIKDIKDRIKFLDNIIEEEKQGQDNVLKCE